MKRGVYVTGTDTGVGKTVASVALLHDLRARGVRAVGMKPVAAGCDWRDGGWYNDDALALQAASDPSPPYDWVNPIALAEPTAPQIAARLAGAAVTLPPLLEAYARLQVLADQVIVEGAGGWLAPFADDLEQAQVARAFDLPVVLVVGLKLGCLNHARLTARAILADGLVLAGWIASDVDPGLAHADDYFDLVRRALPVPCLRRLPHQPRAGL